MCDVETITVGIIDFYKKGIEKNIMEFCDSVAGLLSHAERHHDENERQRIIMEDIMIVFDTVSCKNEEKDYATDIFIGYDDDKVTNYQLDVIKKLCSEFPKCHKSCDIILDEGY